MSKYFIQIISEKLVDHLRKEEFNEIIDLIEEEIRNSYSSGYQDGYHQGQCDLE